jgi:predicted permease
MAPQLGDVRYAFRQFRAAPVFTATVLLTLAIGIGGTTAIFSLIHAIMLRSLPVVDPATLYRIGSANNCCVQGGPQDEWGTFPYPFFERLKETTPEFAELTAFQAGGNRYSVRRETVERVPQPLRGEFVTGNYFVTFGIRPFAGRLFTADDDRSAAAPVAVLSHRAWQAKYAADPSVVGSSVAVEGHPFTIVGIAPPGFFGETLRSSPPELWLPLQQEPMLLGASSLLRQPISAWLRVIGRLRPGASIEGMSPRLTAMIRQFLEHDAGYPAALLGEVVRTLPRQTISVIPAGRGVGAMQEQYGQSLRILLGVCGLVLLIACANVANLLLARGMERRSQTAVRLALGAPRRRIVVQSLVESVLLAVGGGLAGLFVADLAGRLLLALAFQSADVVPLSTAPSMPVFLFAMTLSAVTGVVFGTAPAWLATHIDPIDGLRGVNRTAGDRSSLPRSALLVVQATVSVVLVAGAAMLARSLANLERQDFGFQTINRVHVALNPPPASYSAEQLDMLYRTLQDRLTRVPGIQQAALALYAPFTDNWSELVVLPGQDAAKINEQSSASWNRVSPAYFSTVGHVILRGRGFTDADDRRTAPVAVVNETFVRRFFPNQDVIDKHFGIDLPETAGTFRIVGVVRDAKYQDPEKPAQPMFFVALAQHVQYAEPLLQKLDLRAHYIGSIVLETRTAAGALEPLLRQAIADADPNLSVITVRPLADDVALNFEQQRAVAGLATLFGVVAVLLAAIGLYGVTAYTVAGRRNEFGVRMALGADRAIVIGLVLRSAFRTVAVGLALGVPLAMGAGRLIGSQLYGVSPIDPAALGLAFGALCATSLIAALIPASRAAASDPIAALRAE